MPTISADVWHTFKTVYEEPFYTLSIDGQTVGSLTTSDESQRAARINTVSCVRRSITYYVRDLKLYDGIA